MVGRPTAAAIQAPGACAAPGTDRARMAEEWRMTAPALPRVQIVSREHPHFEEYGRFTGKVITMRFGDGREMAEVQLENCPHGGDACFVSRGDVRKVAER